METTKLTGNKQTDILILNMLDDHALSSKCIYQQYL